MQKTKTLTILVLVLLFIPSCANLGGTPFNEPTGPVISRILKNGELVVGTTGSMPPLNMTNKKGEIIGMEADLAKMIANAMEVKLRLKAMPFSELLPSLERGEVDMILSSMTITPSRNLKVAFVGPYYITGKAFLTKMERIASAQRPSEINNPNITLVALKGSTSQSFVEEAVPRAQLITTQNYDEAVRMVIEDKVNAMVADYPICVVSVLRYPKAGMISVLTRMTFEPLGIALPANDPHLVNWTQNFLSVLQGTGKLEALTQRWFGNRSWLRNLP
ncbi:transporter substrate-binding domain-containing protein [Thermodesulfobacteriota bacterium]